MGNKYLKYFKTICIHKWYVFVECYKQDIIWQGIIHDLSKFSPKEFFPSAKYYNGDGNDNQYQEAWLHHKGHNKHHWEYWVDWNSDTGNYIISEIPLRYMKEMYADMVGASKAYNKDKFDKGEPLKYFDEKCKGWVIFPENREWLRNMLQNLSNNN